MNVGELKQLLEPVDDSVEVVTDTPDHGYWRARAMVIQALRYTGGDPSGPDYRDSPSPGLLGPWVDVLFVGP